MIRHTVMFKWTAEATHEQRLAVQTELAALAPVTAQRVAVQFTY